MQREQLDRNKAIFWFLDLKTSPAQRSRFKGDGILKAAWKVSRIQTTVSKDSFLRLYAIRDHVTPLLSPNLAPITQANYTDCKTDCSGEVKPS
uniref:Uncharacterized protein n=1 Tax=Vespula pensylvanica TaxID=30213 RepID=A0A834JPJ2_VESPE|nr:hypothetical protein H0235_017716 [Vespula pensylvanica]